MRSVIAHRALLVPEHVPQNGARCARQLVDVYTCAGCAGSRVRTRAGCAGDIPQNALACIYMPAHPAHPAQSVSCRRLRAFALLAHLPARRHIDVCARSRAINPFPISEKKSSSGQPSSGKSRLGAAQARSRPLGNLSTRAPRALESARFAARSINNGSGGRSAERAEQASVTRLASAGRH
jgi:hypothetical protein